MSGRTSRGQSLAVARGAQAAHRRLRAPAPVRLGADRPGAATRPDRDHCHRRVGGGDQRSARASLGDSRGLHRRPAQREGGKGPPPGRSTRARGSPPVVTPRLPLRAGVTATSTHLTAMSRVVRTAPVVVHRGACVVHRDALVPVAGRSVCVAGRSRLHAERVDAVSGAVGF
jgi:hypothetical protein